MLQRLSVIKLRPYRIRLLRHEVEYRHGVRYVHIVVVVYVAADKSFVGKQFLFRNMVEHKHGVGDVNLTAAVRVAVNKIGVIGNIYKAKAMYFRIFLRICAFFAEYGFQVGAITKSILSY